MKKFLSGLLLGILLTVALPALAQQSAIKLIVNGKEVPCDPPPQMINNRVFVPVRFVAEALGANVDWNHEKNTVIINTNINDQQPTQTKEVTTMPLSGMINVQVNNKLIENAQKEVIINGEIYISIRLLSELLADSGKIVSVTVPPGQIGYDQMVINYANVAKTIDNHTYIPLSLLENVGILRYSWDNNTKTLTISILPTVPE